MQSRDERWPAGVANLVSASVSPLNSRPGPRGSVGEKGWRVVVRPRPLKVCRSGRRLRVVRLLRDRRDDLRSPESDHVPVATSNRMISSVLTPRETRSATCVGVTETGPAFPVSPWLVQLVLRVTPQLRSSVQSEVPDGRGCLQVAEVDVPRRRLRGVRSVGEDGRCGWRSPPCGRPRGRPLPCSVFYCARRPLRAWDPLLLGTYRPGSR